MTVPITILIVDDEEGFRHILQVVLQRGGYQTITATNALEARAVIEHERPSLVILDDMMPGMSGSELCIQLKADERTRAMPVIMHSANSKLHDKAYVRQIGADQVLLKPTSPRDILNTVGQFVAQV